jgi:hypothetical protein
MLSEAFRAAACKCLGCRSVPLQELAQLLYSYGRWALPKHVGRTTFKDWVPALAPPPASFRSCGHAPARAERLLCPGQAAAALPMENSCLAAGLKQQTLLWRLNGPWQHLYWSSGASGHSAGSYRLLSSSAARLLDRESSQAELFKPATRAFKQPRPEPPAYQVREACVG